MRTGFVHRLVAATACAVAAVAVFAVPQVGAAKKPPRLTIKMFDNYYAPVPKKAIKPGTLVRWTGDASMLDVHDVKLEKAPKGVKKFASDPMALGVSFSRALKTPGKYSFICTFHTEMKMQLTVAKR